MEGLLLLKEDHLMACLFEKKQKYIAEEKPQLA
ncbi:hypothetical protein A2U01_0038483, partial [Trifolium medium]|nr:hypothetical protein [Trifolium medium]